MFMGRKLNPKVMLSPTYFDLEPGGGNKSYFWLLTQLAGQWPSARFLLFPQSLGDSKHLTVESRLQLSVLGWLQTTKPASSGFEWH